MGSTRCVDQLFGILSEEEDPQNVNYLNFNGSQHISLNDSVNSAGFANALNDLLPTDILSDKEYNMDITMGLELLETNSDTFFFRRSDFTRHLLSYWDAQSF